LDVAVARGMKFPYKYRNKVQYPVKDGKSGFYRRRSHEIVEHRLCAVQPDDMNDVMNQVKQHIDDYPFIRNVVFRYGTEGLMVVFVCTKSNPDLSELVELIVGKFKSVKSIVVNYNKADTNTILGKNNKALYGNDYITDKLLGMEYKISPNSFYQINKEQARYLYTKISGLAGLTGKETVYDLYCGIGSIGMHLARKAEKVVGVESVRSAVRDARANARHNNVKNIRFVEGKAEEVTDELVEKYGKPDVVVVDPPRKGCDEKLLKSILKMGPDKIIYVSCNPSTFARDLKTLCEKGEYSPGKVQPIDMFPFTSHVETVVLMSRVEK
jgi:23S rRNA (uracil1939-C5)-methyltransferase